MGFDFFEIVDKAFETDNMESNILSNNSWKLIPKYFNIGRSDNIGRNFDENTFDIFKRVASSLASIAARDDKDANWYKKIFDNIYNDLKSGRILFSPYIMRHVGETVSKDKDLVTAMYVYTNDIADIRKIYSGMIHDAPDMNQKKIVHINLTEFGDTDKQRILRLLKNSDDLKLVLHAKKECEKKILEFFEFIEPRVNGDRPVIQNRLVISLDESMVKYLPEVPKFAMPEVRLSSDKLIQGSFPEEIIKTIDSSVGASILFKGEGVGRDSKDCFSPVGYINLCSFLNRNNAGTIYLDVIGLIQQIHRMIYYLNGMKKVNNSKHKSPDICIGFHGFADVIFESNKEYGSQQSVNFARMIASIIDGTMLYSTLYNKGIFDESDKNGTGIFDKILRRNADSKGLSKTEIRELFDRVFDILIGQSEMGSLFVSDAKRKLRKITNFLKTVYSEGQFVDTASVKEDIINNKNVYDRISKLFVSTLQEPLINISAFYIDNSKFIADLFGVFPSVEPIPSLIDYNPIIEGFAMVRKLNDEEIKWVSEGNDLSRLNPKWKTALDIYTNYLKVYEVFAEIDDYYGNFNIPIDDFSNILDIVSKCYKAGIKNITLVKAIKPSLDLLIPKDSVKGKIEATKDNPSLEVEDHGESPDLPLKVEEREEVPAERPLVLKSLTERASTPFGYMYLNTGYSGDSMYECFIKLGKSGSDISALIEAIARLISLGLQNGIPLKAYIDTLEGIIGKEEWKYTDAEGKESTVYSIPDLMSKMLTNLSHQISLEEK